MSNFIFIISVVRKAWKTFYIKIAPITKMERLKREDRARGSLLARMIFPLVKQGRSGHVKIFLGKKI